MLNFHRSIISKMKVNIEGKQLYGKYMCTVKLVYFYKNTLEHQAQKCLNVSGER